MSEDNKNREPGTPEDPTLNEDMDTGEPIAMLLDLAEEPVPGFVGRIRGALQRRLLASQLADLSWFTPVLVFLEYLKVIFGIFEVGSRERGESE